MKIPNNKPYRSNKENEYITGALLRGQTSGDGYYTAMVTDYLKNTFQANEILMTTSGTHALEMAALLIDLKLGDEVIMPSYSFPSTACAVMLRGAKPVFAEVLEDTLNIDPRDIVTKISSKTRALICVHYGGIGCDLDQILKIAKQYNLRVIEDAAQAVNSTYKGKYLGTIADFGCYSFHGTKNYSCGEGGALLINNNEYGILEKAEAIRQKGTNRSSFLRGEVDKYTWVEIGSSYPPSDILMAVLLAQLSEMQEITAKRKVIYEYYLDHLQDYIKKGVLRTIRIPEECEPNYHLFCVIFHKYINRDRVMQQLKSRGIDATFHFTPLHSSPMGRELGYVPEDLKITEEVSRSLLRLPIYPSLTEDDMEYVITNFKEVVG